MAGWESDYRGQGDGGTDTLCWRAVRGQVGTWIVSELRRLFHLVGRPQKLNGSSLVKWKMKGIMSQSLKLGPGPSFGGGN